MPRASSRTLAAAAAIVLAATAATTPRPIVVAAADVALPRSTPAVSDAAEPEFVFRLADATDAGDAARPAVPRPAAGLLDDADTQRLLQRLPPLADEPREEAFAKREESLPPPRSGRTLAAPFPPPAADARPEPGDSGPLSVLRRAPEGEVALAPQLSITFSQPMVAVTSHGELSRDAAPVRLSPETPGEWRWVGTRTLVFEPRVRFPMATEFRVSVPAGTRSASGAALASAVAWSFGTPAPRLVARHPEGGPSRPDTLLFAAFDQRVDPAAVLGSFTVRAGSAGVPLRLATAAELERDEAVARLVRDTQPGRFVVFTAQRPLPPDAAVTVTVGRGAPSAEGPRRTGDEQSWSFRTYGPFRVRGHECGWGGRCQPFQPWRIELTNPVDAKSLRKERVRVEPELPGLKVDTWGDAIGISGATRGRTRYRVTLSREITDVFGQPLEAHAPLSFAVGPAEPLLFSPARDLLVLDPSGPRSVPVYSVNHARLRVRAWAVGPEHWRAWGAYRQQAWREDAPQPPGRLAIDTTLETRGRPDELTETRIDLSPALTGGLGQLVLVVEPAVRSRQQRRNAAVRAWVQSTRIGLDAFSDGQSLVAWATRLEDGRSLADATVALPPGASARTDASGLARLPLGPDAPLLVARSGDDLAILPSSSSWWGGSGWQRKPAGDSLAFFVFDDRGLYKPGEDVRLKGWLRRMGHGPRGDVEPLPAGVAALAWTLRDSRGNEVAKGRRTLGALGAFDLTLKLPPTMNLGDAALLLEVEGSALEGRRHSHPLQVQEFRRPEFEVKAATSSEGPFVVGGHATVDVSAAYYAGGALPGADLEWRVESRAASFRPPNREDFVFGSFVPWWERHGEPPATSVQTHASRTDGAGRHRLRIDFERARPPRPRHLEVQATVMDVNRQAWTASARLLVHPALDYVGLRAQRPFVQKGEPIAVDAIVTDLDGAALAGRAVSLQAERLDWEQVDGTWTQVPKDAQVRELQSGAEPARVLFAATEGGVWRVRARIRDGAGRPNESELRVWVAGGRVPPRRELEEEQVTLVPERREYAAGDVARVLVMAPFAPAEGLLTLRRAGLLREQRFTVPAGSTTLEIPIEEGMTPNVHVQVDLVGSAPREGGGQGGSRGVPARPAYASGSLDLPVPPRSRTLGVSVKPRAAALEPGGETVIDLALRDASGRPVADGEATVVVVDEAVLALTGYRLPDPVSTFYATRGSGVSDYRLREQVLLAKPEDLLAAAGEIPGGVVGGVVGSLADAAPQEAMAMAPPPAPATRMMAKGAGGAAEPEPIRARLDFSALALFAASVPTDAQGRAQVPVKLPDNLTRYRVMAIAASGSRQFGSAEATLTARLPLMVRPSAPRFLNFGDRFELPVVVQNQTERPLTVDVAVRARNAALTAGAGRRLVVPANDRAEVRFPMAAQRAGRARIQVGAASGDAADAAEVELPVWTPATSEAFATYGQLDQGAVVQSVRAPRGVVPQFGGLEITTSSTALSALTDAMLYLVAYPFECAEQLSSRVLAVAALRDVLTAFRAEGLPAPAEIEAAVKRDLERLRGLQNPDGGFGFWRRGDDSWPYVSIHVAHALVRAKARGYDVPQQMLDASQRYLREFEQRLPREDSLEVRRTLAAYALSVRALSGSPDPARARALVREAGVEALSFEALGFVLPTLSKDPASAAEVAAIRRRLANAVDETAAAAHFAVSYGDGAYLLLHSDRRADAILLEALIADQPKSDLVPKLVEGLLAHRKAGRWTNTQENVFVLLALDRYFQAYEKTTPDFVARAWLGERYAGEHAFRGRSADRQHVAIPMSAVLDGPPMKDLLLSKDGPGRLYYRVGLRYAPDNLVLEPLDRGFTVERAYEAIDDPSDVRRDADGSWRVRAGARVRVRLTMVAPARRYHVALVDPLPAGFEALNPALAVTGTLPGDGGSEVTPLAAPGLGGPRVGGHWWWWRRPWFEHQNLRDERAEAFSSLLWEGVHTYRYVARATTPGTFVVPPTKAEEMYAPETFGRASTDRVIVE